MIMKVLQVIHGYPPRYNAGSEVYIQGLAQKLAERHKVHIFTRQENPFLPEYDIREEYDQNDARIKLHIVNIARSADRYRHTIVDQRFAALLDQLEPDIVHVQHLNHLSTSLVQEARLRDRPIIFTLHDYWLMCPRGQFIQRYPIDNTDVWALCDGQDNTKCAERCYARYFSGASEEHEIDLEYWSNWVHRRMTHIHELCQLVDLFLAPSQYLLQRFTEEFGLPKSKIRYLDYGFQLDRLRGRYREAQEPFTFGYIGTHIPAKGVHHLIKAFAQISGICQLRIWGRHRGIETSSLQALAKAGLQSVAERVEWMGEYHNQDIVDRVFNRCDALIVPSIWAENSPLVIHEALQARVPLITADYGGMAEYVKHEINGLLFKHRDPNSLAAQMQRLVENPELAKKLGARGYLQSDNGSVTSVEEHALRIEEIYRQFSSRQDSATRFHRAPTVRPGPWRITFDTNPDDCNLHCIMCEEHSLHSSLQRQRIAAGIPKRRMDIELIRQVLKDSVGTPLREIIPSTMGEPLLYRHIDEIIDLCAKYHVKLNLTTNGTFPRRGARAWAQRIVPVGSDVKISWNGACKETQESIMLGSRWEQVLANVRAFIEIRDMYALRGGDYCRVTFQLTFMETNVDELADIVKLASTLGVDRVKGHHLWAHFQEIKSLSMRRSVKAIERWNAAVVAAQEAAERYRLPSNKRVLLENIFPLDTASDGEIVNGAICPFLGQEAWISAEGRFNPCCAPDALRKSLGEFGNLNDVGLYSIWESLPYAQLRASYLDHALCHTCNMRRLPAKEE